MSVNPHIYRLKYKPVDDDLAFITTHDINRFGWHPRSRCGT